MSEASIRIRVAEDVALHVRIWGPPPIKLLLVHGFGQGGFVWRALAHSMPECGIAAVDLRGHGDSDRDRTRHYSVVSHVEDVITVARALELRDYVLIGHSLGAAVSILAAERLPCPPRAVVLIDGGPGLSVSASAYIRDEFLRSKFRYHSIAEYQEHLQASMPLAATSLLHAIASDALQALGPAEFRLKADRALGYQEPCPRLEQTLWDALERIMVPLLLVRGAVSALCSKRWTEDFLARIPHATVEAVDRAGHAVMLDNPVRFNALVRHYVSHWLDSHGAPPLHLDQLG
ncbi:pimeloyl-ACP methyl ester carboxylesterase [Xanthomonas arboricola]|uniref:alpha/beta fold hydrolase n=1 Tax=Xanthomonas euroxanthea TaxID=2259622 RepID=UPI001431784B|nr:alpha/beta hydrolase [Xanthomonas euroxanthea]NJC37106.1 pimeloyl-ACP methyl ester carboxylesterase [Xanthomonas euroxanthea]